MTPVAGQVNSILGERSVQIWESETHQASAFQPQEGVIRLAIRRVDDTDGMGWDELQAIKSACGFGDFDAVEFYPPDKDVVNLGNLRHLYIFDAKLPLILRPSEKRIDHG